MRPIKNKPKKDKKNKFVVSPRPKKKINDTKQIKPKKVEISEDILLGRNAVREALKSGRSINRILIADSAHGGSMPEIMTLARERRIIVQNVNTEKLDQICGGQRHQGIAAYAAPVDYVELDDILNLAKERNEDPFIILLDELEDALIQADVGVKTSLQLMDDVRAGIKKKQINSPEDLKPFLIKRITEMLNEGSDETNIAKSGPTVILVIGVNGVGKTTTIGKLGRYYKEQGKNVMFAAADTFRAAAIDQLEIWGQRVNVPVIKHEEGSDPAAVVFDAVKAAIARKVDILIIDTAGRLHNKANLMTELNKIQRVIKREIAEAPHETLLVLDATTGQNAISQAELFTKSAPISGLVLTKLDGTAKGGVVIGLKSELSMPVKWIGVGEGMDDLRPFVANDFAAALFNQKVEE